MTPAQADPAPENSIYLPIILANFDTHWPWSPKVSLTLSPVPNHLPLVAIDHQGQLHVWWDTLASPRLIYHTYLSAQGWLSPTAIAQTLGTSDVMFPPLVDANGAIHFAWRNDLGSSFANRYRIMYSRFNGTQWSSEEDIFQNPFGLQAMVHTDTQGSVSNGALVTTSAFGLTSSTYDFAWSPQGWTTFGPFTPSPPASWVWPDMQGAIRFFGDHGTNTIAFTLWQDGLVLTAGQTVAGGLVSSRQTQLDGQNNLHVFWTGQAPVTGGFVTGVLYQCLSNQLLWNNPIVLSGSDAVSGLAGKASDNVSRVVLGFKKAATGEVALKLYQGCDLLASSIVTATGQFDVAAIALSRHPSQLCVLLKAGLTVGSYESLCSDIGY